MDYNSVPKFSGRFGSFDLPVYYFYYFLHSEMMILSLKKDFQLRCKITL